MARDCGDVALLLAVLAGLTEVPESERECKGTRIAWLGEVPGMPFEAAVRDIVNGARRHFDTLGCHVDDATPDFTDADAAFRILRAHEFYSLHGSKPRERMKETVQQEIARGEQLTAADIARAHTLRDGLRERVAAFQAQYEFFILPTVQVLPFDIEQPYVTTINGAELPTYIDWMRSCYFISILGVPALSVPCGLSAEGLPVGLQIVGRAGADWDVLGLGSGLEQVIMGKHV
jgi:amidase